MKNTLITILLVSGLICGMALTMVGQSVYQETGAKAAVGLKFSTLGAGIEVATPVTHRSNLRFGFNAFGYGRGFDKDNIHYDADITFRSLEAHYDIFCFGGGFHISPGFVSYLNSPISAGSRVPGGQAFTLGATEFVSDPTNPITGKGKIDFNRAGPSFTVGWGNLLPRSAKRFTVPFEVGFVYQGAPKTTLNLTGSACDLSGANCRNAINPLIQSQVQAEQRKISNDIDFLQVYPIVSIGFGFKF